MVETNIATPDSFPAPAVVESSPPPLVQPPTGQITSEQLLGKIEAGEPFFKGQELPDVPQDTSARDFYGQFKGGAAVYSLAPFKDPFSYTPPPATNIDFSDFFDPTGQPQQEDTQPQAPTVDTQMDAVIEEPPQGDTGMEAPDLSSFSDFRSGDYSISLNNIDNPEIRSVLKDKDFELTSALEKTLTNGFDNISKGIDQGIDKLSDELDNLTTELGEFVDSPVDYVSDYITGEINTLKAIINDPFGDFSIDKAFDYATSTIMSQGLGRMFAAMGLGPVAGPLASILVSAMSNPESQIGMMGMSYDGGDPLGGSHQGTGNPSAIAGYNALGIAVNSKGQPVYGWNTAAQAHIDLQFKSASSAWNTAKTSPTDEELHGKYATNFVKSELASKEEHIEEETGWKGDVDADTDVFGTQQDYADAWGDWSLQDDAGGEAGAEDDSAPSSEAEETGSESAWG